MTEPTRPILRLQPNGGAQSAKPAHAVAVYTPALRQVGKRVRIHLFGGMTVEAVLRKVHTYDYELADGRVVPKHAVLLIEPRP